MKRCLMLSFCEDKFRQGWSWPGLESIGRGEWQNKTMRPHTWSRGIVGTAIIMEKKQQSPGLLYHQSGCPLDRPFLSASSKCLHRLMEICWTRLQIVHCNFRVIFFVVLACQNNGTFNIFELCWPFCGKQALFDHQNPSVSCRTAVYLAPQLLLSQFCTAQLYALGASCISLPCRRSDELWGTEPFEIFLTSSADMATPVEEDLTSSVCFSQ